MESVIEKVQKEYEGKAEVKNIVLDTSDEGNNIPRKYKIRVVPTLIFFNKDGSEYKRIEGYLSQKDIEEIFSKMGVK